jgi:D-alanyl-D-alanine carboxypeptidase
MSSHQILELVQRFEKANDCGTISLVVESETGPTFEQNSESLTLIASVTKVFTATLTLLLAEQKVLSLEDPLEKFLSTEEIKGLNNYKGEDHSNSITLENLLRQDSGIPNYYLGKRPKPGPNLARRVAEDPGWSFSEALELAKTYPSPFAPGGKKSNYSFTNYQILSEILERATKKPLAGLFETHLCAPLKLASTALLTPANLELFYQSEQILYGKELYLGARRMASLRGEGALVSSTKDVVSFWKKLFEGDLLSRQAIGLMTSKTKPIRPLVRYGLGTMKVGLPGVVIGRRQPVELVGHFGASSSFAFYLPEFSTYIAGTLNQMASPLLAPKLVSGITRIVAKNQKRA